MGYLRFLMPLESEATGYGFKGRTPAGRCVVESRGGDRKVTIWAQDIQPETRYGVYVIFAEAEGRFAGVFLGNVNACEKGKIEARHSFNQIAQSKFSLETFVAVAVVAEVAGSVISPLCGYREKTVAWRSGFYVVTEEEEKPTVVEDAPVVVKETPVAVEETPVAVEEEPIVEEAPIVAEETPAVAEEEPTAVEEEPAAVENQTTVVEPLPLPDPTPAEAPAPPPRPRQTAPRARKPKETVKTPKRSCGKSENALAVEAIFNNKPQEAPFENTDGTRWVKLTISDAVPLPDNRPLLLEEPFVRAAYANYAHLMLGITEDKTEYILAVPGEYAPNLRAQAKRMGFTKFLTNAGKTAKHGDFGYWLMFVAM